MCVLSHFGCVRLFAPLSMEFSRQEYCSGQPFLSPGDLPDPGMEPGSPNCRQILPHQGSPKESEEGLLVNLDHYSKYHKLGQKSNIKVSRDLVSCESSLLGLQMVALQLCPPLLCFLDVSASSSLKSYRISQCPTFLMLLIFITSLRTIYPNTVSLGVRFSTYEFEETRLSLQQTLLCFSSL